MILLVNTGFLFSTKINPDDHRYPYMFEINRYTRIFINNDALGYVRAASNPHCLITQNEMRQSRPLYILQNTLIGNFLLFISTPFHEYLQQNPSFKNLGNRVVALNQSVVDDLGDKIKFLPNVVAPHFDDFDLSVTIPVFYFAYILSNFIVLLLSLLIFEGIYKKITNETTDSPLFFIFCFFLLTGLETKYFFWTAHQQMCNILSPLFSVWVCLSILDGSINTLRKLFLLSFIGGILMLYYGNFLLILPCILAPYIWKYRKEISIPNLGFVTITASVLFAIPNLFWMLYLKLIGITYYNHEVTCFREIVWVFELFKLKPIQAIKEIAGNCIWYSRTFMVLVPSLIWLLFILILFGGRNLKNSIKKEQFSAILFCFLLNFLLYYFIRLYGTRLTYAASIPIVCLSPLLINKDNMSKGKVYLLLAGAIAWYLFTLLHFR